MKITVTKADINNGIDGDVFNCPIALSLKRLFNTNDVVVSWNTCYIGDDLYILPDEVSNFISMFDCGYDVVPFEFELDRGDDR